MTEERWIEAGRRRDGLAILEGIDGYMIMPYSEGLPVDCCPTCTQRLATKRIARTAAEFLFPMESDADAD
jgi:hypothetical protein